MVLVSCLKELLEMEYPCRMMYGGPHMSTVDQLRVTDTWMIDFALCTRIWYLKSKDARNLIEATKQFAASNELLS